MKELEGLKVGIVFGCYAPMHQGHLDLVFKAKKECDAGVIIIVCGSDNDRGCRIGLPLEKRFQYIMDFFQDDELVKVIAIDESKLAIDEYPNGWDKWLEVFKQMYQTMNVLERCWYVGEEDYQKQLAKRGETAVYVNRNKNQISATLIRQNPLLYWHKIVPTFRHHFSHNILITGTASEGKSTLVNDLSKYFSTVSTVEYGKESLLESQIDERYLKVEDYLNFLENQYQLTKTKINSKENNGVFFADTDNLVTRMYAEYYATDNDFTLSLNDYKLIEKEAVKYNEKYRWDKIFLIYPHNKFVDDGIRYMKHSKLEIRLKMYEILCEYLKEARLWDKVVVLNGDYYENFIIICDYVKELLK